MVLSSGIVSNQELLDAQTHIWNHLFSYIKSMTLKCTIQLAIPDIIHKHGKPMLLSELTEALSVDEAKIQCVQRLMCMMVNSNFFIMAKISKEDEKEGYWLTPASVLLLRGEPFSMVPFVLPHLDPIFMDPWHHMSEWFKTNHSTPFFNTHGVTLWEYAERDAGLNQYFNEVMATDSRLMSSIIVEDCRHVFQGLRSVVDVGGGTGIMAKAIVNAFPSIKCIVLDLPHVVAASGGTNNDLTFVGGDMFEHIPSADAIFMKWILHDWTDEKCVVVLKKCKQAIPSKEKGGKVIIVDMVVDYQQDHALVETQLLFDMQMMVITAGRERSEKDWENLFLNAGFTSYNITSILGSRSLIEVFP